MRNNQPQDLIKVEEAKVILGVGSSKMAQLIRDGLLKFWTNPLDARIKFVSRKEVESLKQQYEEAA